MKAPIRVRMTVWYVGLLAAVLVAVGTFVVVRLRADLTSTTDRTLRSAVVQIARGYMQEGVPEFRDVSATVLSGEGAGAQVLTPDGRVLAWYGSPLARRPMLGLRDLRVATYPVVRRGRASVVVAAVSARPIDEAVQGVLVLLAVALPVALLAAAAGGWRLARRALSPIDRITTTAAAIDPGQLQARIAVVETHDEVAHLAETLNTMLARIEHEVSKQRRLVADTSHELRTPLAAMRAELDVSLHADDVSPAAREVLESVRDDVDRMSAIVDDLLILASADEGVLTLELETADLRALALSAVESLERLAARSGVVVEVDGPEAFAEVDAERIHQVLRNLLANALDFSPPGGRVSIGTDERHGLVEVTVADEGPGIPVELRDRVFDRFFRADASRTRRGGGGLGLAIAREIVRAHGGTIEAADHHPRGTLMRVSLRAARATPPAEPSKSFV